MKEMYDKGDPQMKQMLNKTWAESQEKRAKGEDPMKDMGRSKMGGFSDLDMDD